MDTDKIGLLMQKHGVSDLYRGGAASAGVEVKDNEFVISFGDLPQLTFFIELAQLCQVPLESIKTKSESYGEGCDTCGYGAGSEITVRVPRLAAPNREKQS